MEEGKANMKCSDDALVTRGAVRLMKQPQKELLSHLLNTCMQALLGFCLTKCLPSEQVRILGFQSVWGPESPDYVAPQVMPETVFQQQ